MTGFAVQPDPLFDKGQQYDLVHSELAAIYSRLTQALDAAGPFWGGDESGQRFARTYWPAAVAQLRQMGATGEGLQSLIAGVCRWATNYVNTDSTVAQSTPMSD